MTKLQIPHKEDDNVKQRRAAIFKDIQNAKDILLRIQMLIERYQDGIIDLMTSTDTVSELLNIGWRSMKDNELNSDHLIVN